MSDTETAEIDNFEYQEVNDQNPDFDPIQYVKGLVNVCKYILKCSDKEAGRVRKGRQNMILTLLLNFEKGIPTTTFADYEKNVFRIFKSHRKEILKDDESWLLQNDVKLELPNETAKSKKNRKVIYLSTIYQKAAGMYDRHKSDPLDKDGNYSEYVLLPNRFFRYLYLLFLEFTEEGDETDIICDHIDRIETQLKITDHSYIEDFGGIGGIGSLLGGNMQDGLKKIFKLVLNTATKSGMIDGDPSGGLDIDKIVDSMSKLFADKETMGNLAKDIGSCKDKKEIMNILMKQIDKPELLEVIRNATGMDIDSEKLQSMVQNSEVGSQIESIVDKVLPKLNKTEI